MEEGGDETQRLLPQGDYFTGKECLRISIAILVYFTIIGGICVWWFNVVVKHAVHERTDTNSSSTMMTILLTTTTPSITSTTLLEMVTNFQQYFSEKLGHISFSSASIFAISIEQYLNATQINDNNNDNVILDRVYANSRRGQKFALILTEKNVFRFFTYYLLYLFFDRDGTNGNDRSEPVKPFRHFDYWTLESARINLQKKKEFYEKSGRLY